MPDDPGNVISFPGGEVIARPSTIPVGLIGHYSLLLSTLLDLYRPYVRSVEEVLRLRRLLEDGR